jgi:hypothetical protein
VQPLFLPAQQCHLLAQEDFFVSVIILDVLELLNQLLDPLSHIL